MNLASSFIFETYRKIKNNLPNYVLRSIIKLTPIYFISSIFEIFGLVVLFPVIKLIIEPGYLEQNIYLYKIYQYFSFTSVVSYVFFLFSSITFFFILKNVFIFLINKKQNKIAFNMANQLALDKYYTYINKPYQFHAESNTAVLLRNITQVPFDFIAYIVLPFIALINEVFILTCIVIAISLYNPILFWSLVLFTVPFLFMYNKIYKKKLKEISEQRNIESAQLQKLGLQSMETFREIVVYNKVNFFKSYFEKTLVRFTQTMSSNYLLNLLSPKIVETVAMLSIFSIFLVGYLLQKELAVLAQFLIVFTIAAYRVIPSLNKIILSSNYIKSSAYLLDFFEKQDLNHTDNIIKKENDSVLVFKNKLEIKELSFTFPNNNKVVLNNLTIQIQKGKTIGIIGTSGAGKTTLLNVLLRLYEENSGGIFVDGVKLDKTNIIAWYNLVSYVPQNITLLDGSILENIAFGIPAEKIDNDLLKKVIYQAQLENFIDGLPIGVMTEIGEKGIKISGGQRQRIGIARALYHGGKILIFDEATSSLDVETEQMLTESINNISHQELTIIIVAHRIQTLKYCDAIYKLENGALNGENL